MRRPGKRLAALLLALLLAPGFGLMKIAEADSIPVRTMSSSDPMPAESSPEPALSASASPEAYTLNWYYNSETGFFTAPVYAGEQWSETDGTGQGYGIGYVLTPEGTATVTGLPAYEPDIPASLGGHPVTAIGRLNLASQLDDPGQVTLPATVGRIEPMAFATFPRNPEIRLAEDHPRFTVADRMLLEKETGRLILRFDDGDDWIENPDGSWSLPPELEKVRVPEGIRKIDGYAFRGQGVTEVRLPEGLEAIGEGAFSECRELKTINIPATVTEMGGNPFFGCDSLETVEIPKNHPAFEVRNGLLIRKSDQTLIAALPRAVKTPAASNAATVSLPQDLRAIGAFAFWGLPLQSLTIPDTVETIGTGALAWCDGLRVLTLPRGLKEIAPLLLTGTAVNKINLPAGVERIGSYAFSDTPMTEIFLPEGLQTLEKSALERTSLKKLELPANLRIVGDWALANNLSLYRVEFSAPAERIGDFAFYGCEALSKVSLEEGHTTIGESAFEYCEELYDVTFPEGLTAIGRNAFRYCPKLSHVILPDSLTELGESAFFECEGLWKLRIPGVTTIGNECFSGCEELYNLELGEGIESIGNDAFSRCRKLNSVALPYSLRSIGECAFSYCAALGKVILPPSVTEIGKDAFRKCPDSLVFLVREGSFGERYCLENGLQTVLDSMENLISPAGWIYDRGEGGLYKIPQYVWNRSEEHLGSGTGGWMTWLPEEDGSAAITGIDWQTVEIPALIRGRPVTTIRRLEIYDRLVCTDFLFIPSSVTTIEPMAFSSLIYTPKISLLPGNHRFVVRDDLLLEPEAGRLLLRFDEFHAGIELGAHDWEYTELPIKERIEVPAGIRVIDGYAFRDQAMTEVHLPEGLEEIGEGAFSGCGNLKRINIPLTVTELEGNPFFCCGAMETVEIPENHPVFEIRDGLLIRKTDQTLIAALPWAIRDGNLVLPEAIRHIGANAFRSTNLKSVVIPDSVVDIGEAAFAYCYDLRSIRLPSGLRELAPAALACTLLPTISLPESLTKIGQCAFAGNWELTSLSLPNTVETIGNEAFKGCDKLTSVSLPPAVREIGTCAFDYCADDLILRVAPGSFAETWCARNNLKTELK